MVVLSTDHGTLLGEHQYWMKNLMPVYNEIAHIPLIVHLPGSQRAGARVAGLTQTTDLMPTFLDYFGAPAPPHLHGTSLRPSIESDRSIHDSIIYGYFGMALNATDGRHTYLRNPTRPDATVYAYTSMPTQFHDFMPREQLAQAEMGRFLGHTYNIPLYKVPFQAGGLSGGGMPHRHGGYESAGAFDPHHELFDIAADPTQERPLADAALEARFSELMRAHLGRVAAPSEQYQRLGL
jgi:hypothetical protein